ncbi:intermembrane transport protein PqiB [Utexia brackfieldae]|uniref:intermembrane transport protein PqiB n=1 Tax=Utexia brackfieldae TaxID=3074108 RepID=UPI00370DB5A1
MPNKTANVAKIKFWSPVWIVPIITAIIGLWVLYVHFSDQGKSFTLVTSDASSIVAGKTMIKSRNVNVGLVEQVTLSDDFKEVLIKGRMSRDMDDLLMSDSIFWIVKPQIDRDGVSGLSTLFSGVYIEVIPGTKKLTEDHKTYQLLDSPPMVSLNKEGVRLHLIGEQTSVISQGAPVLFRGFKVGNVEQAEFDVKDKYMKYQVFIAKPYDSLITKNIRFWREGGISFDLSTHGASLDIPSLDVLLAGGISFDVPDGSTFGETQDQQQLAQITYQLYEDKELIQESQYTEYQPFLLLFSDSIAGLSAGAPVEYRGIRIGTVEKVPYFLSNMKLISAEQYNIPVLIHIEPQRLAALGHSADELSQMIMEEQKHGLRAAIKSANLFTGATYVDLDFYPESITANKNLPQKVFGFNTIVTVSSGFSQLQAKLNQLLDNLNQLPLDKTINELNKTVASLNSVINSKEMKILPKTLQESLNGLNQTLKGIQPGSDLNQALQADLQKFDQVLNELTPLLRTLNDKSNALIFSAPTQSDVKPKARGNK